MRQDLRAAEVPRGECPHCDILYPGICPCAWCDQPGHIAQDCMAHFADSSMQARFPKKDGLKKSPIKHYECRQCGESHPFNIYCPTIRFPPIIPGECRSCGTMTRKHANYCQYITIKDIIGLCTYCWAQDHCYAVCPQRIADQEAKARERNKNKKNNRKRGKVKIVAGVMTREQDSDSTLPPEGERREIEILSPHRPGERRGALYLQVSENVPKMIPSPQEVVCSFCGVTTHNYKNCPVLHQYIREQADALAQRRLGEYQQVQDWARHESPKQIPTKQEPL